MNPQPASDRDPRLSSDFPKFVCTLISDQIKQADAKAIGVLSILGIVTAALLSRLGSLKGISGLMDPKWVFIFSFSVVMIVITMKFIVRVVYPRASKGGNGNMLYFKDIATQSKEDYLTRGLELNNADIIRETYADAYNLAKVADKKYAALRRAMIATTVTIIWTIAVLLLS